MEAARSAEYKQATVLFADVVHSMDIAAAVGPERFREIMAELVDRAASVVKRYGGIVDKFTGSARVSGGDGERRASIDELLDRAVAAINRGDRVSAMALAGQVLVG